jgi:hypothetical protein
LPRALVVGLLAVVVAVTSSSVVYALWLSNTSTTFPAMNRGVVSFFAQERVEPGDTASPEYSSGGQGATGSPVTVTLPGSVVAEVLNANGDPVIWRFDVSGHATGIAGLTYDVSYPLPNDDTPGVIDSVREGATMKVYQADGSGDCTTQPAHNAHPQKGQDNVTLAGTVLQAPGTYATLGQQTQTWCVALHWDADPPKPHLNVATVAATADDGSTVAASAMFAASIVYVPSLDPNGLHKNTAHVEATGMDGSRATADHSWSAILTPDPSLEPDIPITVTPHVTSLATPPGP